MKLRQYQINFVRTILLQMAVLGIVLSMRASDAVAPAPNTKVQEIARSNLLQSGYMAGTNTRPLQPSVATPPSGVMPAQTGSLAATNSSPATNVPTASKVDALDDKYHLVIGDQLSFQVLEDEEPPVVLPVTDSGEIQVPYLGRYPAEGKTCKELASQLKAELEKKYYYQATVVIAVNSMPRSRGKIYLVGAIRVPGPQEISSDETLTVSRAILRAGGFTEFANDTKVKVTRGSSADKKFFTIDVSRILEKGETDEDLPLQPGDMIYIPERMIRF
jgi:protein involved in polysaccharide export with SLBB domain